MSKRTLGTSGIEVHPVGLGGMPMSIQGRPDKARSMDTLKAAFEAGVTSSTPRTCTASTTATSATTSG